MASAVVRAGLQRGSRGTRGLILDMNPEVSWKSLDFKMNVFIYIYKSFRKLTMFSH